MMMYPVPPVLEIITAVNVTEAVRVLRDRLVREAAREYQALWDRKARRENLESRDIPEQLARPGQQARQEHRGLQE